MSEQAESGNGVGLRPYVYRRIDGTMSDQPLGSTPKIEPDIIEHNENKAIIIPEQEPVIVELSIIEHFEAILAKIPVEEFDEEKQRLLDIARDEVESVKRTVKRALTYGT